MIDKMLGIIQAYGMLLPGECVLVGFSGGADSTALLHALNALKDVLKIKVCAAHINHGLRGQMSDQDALHAKSCCESWSIPFFLKQMDVLTLSSALGISVEEAGRRVRYDFFKEAATSTGCHKVATAHHMGDQAETILHHLIRGTGLKGLSGIHPVREGTIIRPLLRVTRKEIESYLTSHDIPYRTDHTNRDNTYTRNRLRNTLIPKIEQDYNPAFMEALVRTGEAAREDDEFITNFAMDCYQKIGQASEEDIGFALNAFNACHPSIKKRLLLLSFKALGSGLTDIGTRHLEDILSLAAAGRTGSTIELPGGLRIQRDYERLRVFMHCLQSMSTFVANDLKLPLHIPGIVALRDTDQVIAADRSIRDVLPTGHWCIYVDEDTIKGSLHVRWRQPGDRFHPLGLKGTQKLKDFFIDKKIPRAQRDGIPLVVDDDTIVWVAGWRMSDKHRVTENTKHVVRLTLMKKTAYDDDDGGTYD